MRMYIGIVAAAALAVSLSLGVVTATAGGSNTANAKACQKGGWIKLQGSDGTQFASEEQCVSFGAHGGTIVAKPPCTAGSENFSGDADGSQPTTFAGGTIDTPFARYGHIVIAGVDWTDNGFPAGTHMLDIGASTGPFRLTFTNAVNSIDLDAQHNRNNAETETLKAYDASNSVVGTDATTVVAPALASLSVSSATNNIKYFTIESTDPGGFAFGNIVWGCAS